MTKRVRKPALIAVGAAIMFVVTVGQMFAIPVLNYVGRLPLLNFTRPEYWPTFAGLPLAVLIALGIGSKGNGREIGFGIAASVVAMSFVLAVAQQRAGTSFPLSVWIAIFIFLFGCAAISYLILDLKGSRIFAVMLVAGMLAEGAYYMNTLRPRRSNRGVDLPQSIQTVKDRLAARGSGRVLNIGRSSLLPDWGSANQIPQVGAMGLVIVHPYLRFFDLYIGRGLFETLDNDSTLRLTPASLAAANIGYIIVDKTAVGAVRKLDELKLKRLTEDPVRIVFEVEGGLPRACLVSGIVESDRLLPDLELGTRVSTADRSLISGARAAGIPASPAVAAGPRSAVIEANHHTRVNIRTNSDTSAVLVLSDSWHPNWRARIDGVETPVGMVNMAFRGVVVPPGMHRVEFRYRPRTLTLGLWVGFATLVGTGLLFLRVTRGAKYF